MNVSIAGVEDVHNPHAVALANFGDPPQYVRQLGPRHHAVLRAVARAQPADGAERLLAALPQFEAFLVVGSLPHFASPAPLAQFDDLIALLVETRFQAV